MQRFSPVRYFCPSKIWLMSRFLRALILAFLPITLFAQQPKTLSAVEVYEGIERLQFLGSALYLAAHPDDENTRMIAYLSNEVKARTAYLSLTRGDGGQNLIGTEIRELLGVIRTQELLAARRIDNGSQFFTRANDFGFSKHPTETRRLWQEDEVISDMVWIMRKWRPDIIINRFDHERAGKTHGHHTTSAILGLEAFDLAGDATKFPEQLNYGVTPWQPTRLYYNTSWWRYGGREAFEKVDKSGMMTVDIGTYYPLRGQSNSEIASYSRSEHKSQGMGNTPRRGSEMEYLVPLRGDIPEAAEDGQPNGDLFAGINTTWTRVPGGGKVGERLAEIQRKFDFKNPGKSVPALVEVYRMIEQLPDGYWTRVKTDELREVIQGALGLYLSATADTPLAVPGDSVTIDAEAIVRQSAKATLRSIRMLPKGETRQFDRTLNDNERVDAEFRTLISPDLEYTNPYWLNLRTEEVGMYKVPQQELRGLSETPRAVRAEFVFEVEGVELTFPVDVAYKQTGRVTGEVWRPFELVPPVYANLNDDVIIYGDDQPKPVRVTVGANRGDLNTTVTLAHPNDWRLEPEQHEVNLSRRGATKTVEFMLYPPAGQSEGKITPIVSISDPETEYYTNGQYLINYDHIPTQTILTDPTIRVVRLDLKKRGERVGYLMGGGDKIPESLEQIGYEVDLLEDEDVTLENLKQYDAVITGIRAYNVRERMPFLQPILFDYVKQGGNLIVQYNTTWGLPSDELAPYPLKLSRERVTDETAEVRILASDHPVVNAPNKITAADFEGWVQERGLYFANEWDADHFTPIFGSNDAGEPERQGGLLVAPYGEGHYVYTGYSWFRELPAGVPGAFRIFTNLISL